MTDPLLFAVGCGVTAIAFGGVYVHMRATFTGAADRAPLERPFNPRDQAQAPTVVTPQRDQGQAPAL
jgi:hypothetical protein